MRNGVFGWSGHLHTARLTGIMDLKLRKLCSWIILCLALTAATLSYAHGHRESGSHHDKGYGQAAGTEEKDGEASGQIAAWFFGIANFPVALSILLKASGKTMAPGSNFRKTMELANNRQKRYLMWLHYWLNPVAAAVAIFHFSALECKSTFIPELGFGLMLLIILLGLMMAFRWSPAPIRKAVYRLHTSPVSLAAAISILTIGHLMIH